MRKTREGFVLCINSDDCDDLVVRKVYRILPDRKASQDGFLRVVDDSGEDYLYPASYFVAVSLPAKAQEAVVSR